MPKSSPSATLTAKRMKAAIRRLANPKRAEAIARFFKTGPGEYGEGCQFLGLVTPDLRRLSREFRAAPLDELDELLMSPMHEDRVLALFILVDQHKRADTAAERARIHRLYVKRMHYVDNWDLVDLSAPQLVGEHLFDLDRAVLHKWIRSPRLWDRRVAMVGTLGFIRRNDFGDTLAFAEALLDDREDLMHKATGWMLREVGKRDRATLVAFLECHTPRLPRTALRYAIEHFAEKDRQRYLRMPRERC